MLPRHSTLAPRVRQRASGTHSLAPPELQLSGLGRGKRNSTLPGIAREPPLDNNPNALAIGGLLHQQLAPHGLIVPKKRLVLWHEQHLPAAPAVALALEPLDSLRKALSAEHERDPRRMLSTP